MKLNSLRSALPNRFRRSYPLYGKEELELLREATRFNTQLMDEIRQSVRPGITTIALNDLAHQYTLDHGHQPACLGYKGFPRSICASINDVVCHGIPDRTELKEGDIVNIDLTTIVNGWYGDQSETFLIGEVSEEARKLTQTAFDALYAGIHAIKPYGTIHDIARAITRHAEGRGYSVVRNYQGHGIGQNFHQKPGVPHYPYPTLRNSVVVPGCCFTIEPMINAGGIDTYIESDGWTVRTKDHSLSAQFEHQIYMTSEGPEILTITEKGPQEGHTF